MAKLSDLPMWLGQYVGLPFKKYGRDRDGLDCWGLCRLILREQADLELPAYTGSHDPNDRECEITRRAESECWMNVPVGTERRFDVARMEWPARVNGQIRFSASHVGLVIARGTILDIEEGKTSWVWSYDNGRARYKLVDIWRHPALT